jgi:hypothetical protein
VVEALLRRVVICSGNRFAVRDPVLADAVTGRGALVVVGALAAGPVATGVGALLVLGRLVAGPRMIGGHVEG